MTYTIDSHPTMFAKIRDGVTVGQDHGWFRWNQDDTIFAVEQLNPRLYKCVARGYGMLPDHYGNGALYIRRLKDLICVDGGE